MAVRSRTRSRGFRPSGEGLEGRRLLADGSLLTTFGSGGLATAAFPISGGGIDFATSTAVQADGKVVVAGYVQVGVGASNYDFGVARFNVDGTLDTTFGSGGLTTVAFDVGGNKGDFATCVAVDTGGRIVVGGYAQVDSTSATDFALARLTTTGQLDTTFNGTGKARTTFQLNAGAINNARALALQNDGKIVIVGESQRGSLGDHDMVIARFLADGTLDTTFGTSGKASLAFNLGGNNYDSARGVAVQADGKIVVGGYAQMKNGGADFAAARLNADGTLDTRFGTSGLTTVAFDLGGNQFDAANALALAPGGQIVLAGRAQVDSAGNEDFAVVRLNANGSLDATFNGSGKATTAFDLGGNHGDYGRSVVVQPDGRVIVAGEVERSASGDFDFSLARWNTDGTLDTTFGNAGKTTIAANLGGNGADYATALALGTDGLLAVAGHATNASGGKDFAVARLVAYTSSAITPTPTPTPSPTPTTPVAASPIRVIGLNRLKKQGKTRAVTVAFSGDGDTANVANLAAYRLTTAGRDGRLGTRDDKVVRVRSVAYDAARRTVTLTLRTPAVTPTKLRLTVVAAGVNVASVASPGADFVSDVPRR